MKSKKAESLIVGLRRVVIIPLLSLGIMAGLIAAGLFYGFMVGEIQTELRGLAYTLQKLCELTGEGEYSEQNGILYKGNTPFDESFSIVDGIQEVTGADATIFWKGNRVQTTVRTKEGERAIGTKAELKVSQLVYQEGNTYFSYKVSVNKSYYIGYYEPLKNTNGQIIGMVFVGKSYHSMMKYIIGVILAIALVMAIVSGISMYISLKYAKSMVRGLNKTKEFLGRVAQGDTDVRLDASLLNRCDEIGQMAEFAMVLQKSIANLVGTDSLTGLGNRRSITIALRSAVEKYDSHKIPFVVAIGDVDDFKKINDEYGHPVGDVVLKEIAKIFMEEMHQWGKVARWGGEEFLFLFSEMEKVEAMKILAVILQRIQNKQFSFDGREMNVTVTFGTANGTSHTSLEAVLKEADHKLYEGKENGKNCIV